jgi:hypothetical protein
MQWAWVSHQPDSRDHKISMSSHKDVRIWMGVSTGAPPSTQYVLSNPSLMRAMASISHHWVHFSFKIVLSVFTFKLHCQARTYLQTMLLGVYLQTVLLGAYLQTASLVAYCFKLCLLVRSVQAMGQGMPCAPSVCALLEHAVQDVGQGMLPRTFKSCLLVHPVQAVDQGMLPWTPTELHTSMLVQFYIPSIFYPQEVTAFVLCQMWKGKG